MAEQIASAVLGKIVEMVVNPIVNTVGRQFSHIFCYKRNTKTLNQQLARLEATRDGVQLRVAAAERNLEIVDPTVNKWLAEVDIIKSNAIAVHEETSNVEKGCLNGWCPNLKHRYMLSRKAMKLTAGIGELRSEGDKNAQFSHPAPPLGIIPSEGPSVLAEDDGVKGFPTRIATMKEVMDALNDAEINLIGISGMGGIGKTTLVNQVLEKVKAKRLFSEVAMAVVSQQPNLAMIQGEIATMLGLKFDEGSSAIQRAKRLSERLKNGRNVLVVLDDIWEGVDLGEIGIPTENGCKVVFTTRMEHSCIKAQRHIKVAVLSEEEAWHLFRKAAGDCVEHTDLYDIAKEVAKECGGLPIAVVTLAKALSDREKCKWDDTRLQLRNSSGLEERVQSSIMLSYNFLESRRPNPQPLLLLCSLFEEDANISFEQLVKYSMGLELFDDVETLEDTRNRVHSLLNELKSCNLLLQGDGDFDVSVKLHDVVRDACSLIASKPPPHSYLVSNGKVLKQWPQRNRHKGDTYTAIALKSGEMKDLPGGLNYPKLSLLQLQLQLDNKKLNIAGDFFQGMRGLQVFNLVGGSIEDYCALRRKVILPPTLGLLTNLKTLSLEFCKLDGGLSLIGCINGLTILSFYKSKLYEFPRELAELKNLKLLDLRCNDSNEDDDWLNIETCVLSGLDQLEVLYLGEYVFSESIKELNSLSCLTTLQICVFNTKILMELEEPLFEKLERFDICIGEYGEYSCGEYGIIRNTICLDNDNGELSWVTHTKLRSLVRRNQSFSLGRLKEDRFMLDERESGFSALSDLESLTIYQMANLREISPDSKIPQGSFHRLRELRLLRLRVLKLLWRGPAQPPSFANLQVLELDDCSSIESLFSPNVAKCMVQLENLKISVCGRLKGVVSNQRKEEREDDNKGFQNIQFPKLKSITLYSLPNFNSLYPESDCGTKQSLFNQWVTFPSLEKIDISIANSVKRIMGYQMHDGPASKLRKITVSICPELKNFVDSTTLENLEQVTITSCDSMEVVFDLAGLKVWGEDSAFVFDKLVYLFLLELKKLAHVWSMVPDGIQGFRNLTTLYVDTCKELRCLMSHSVAKMLVNLQVLKLKNCHEIVGVIKDLEDEECPSTEAMPSNECIVFRHLQDLVLDSLEKLTSFCSSRCSLEFPVLHNVEIQGCPNMKSFCGGEVKAPVQLLKEPVEDPKGKQLIGEADLNNSNYRGKRLRMRWKRMPRK